MRKNKAFKLFDDDLKAMASDILQVSNIFSVVKSGAGGIPVPLKHPPTFVIARKPKPHKKGWGLSKKTTKESNRFELSDINPKNLEILRGRSYLKRKTTQSSRRIYHFK